MDPRAVDKAQSRLRVVQNAIAALEASKTFREFADHWYVFLTAAKSVYTALEQGSKASPQSRQWFGTKKSLRKNDALLQYLFEARNDDEHGLGSSVNLQPERHEIGVAGEGFSDKLHVDGGPFKNCTFIGCGTAVTFEGGPPPPDLRVTPLDNKPVQIRHTQATAILIDVIARGNRRYSPPQSHMGQPLNDNSPLAVANLASAYLQGLVREAATLP